MKFDHEAYVVVATDRETADALKQLFDMKGYHSKVDVDELDKDELTKLAEFAKERYLETTTTLY